MSDARIIEFPKENIIRELPGPSDELIQDRKKKSLSNYADNVSEELYCIIKMELQACGVEVDNEELVKHLAFLSSAIQALIYKSLELEHGMHDFIEDTVQIFSEEDFKEDEVLPEL